MSVPEPLVSIVTPVFNAERFIEETIASVQAQTYKNWELILVDDQSSDNSIALIKQAQKNDERIKLTPLKKNSGVAKARNRGTKTANGEYLAFLDADDTWHKDKLKQQVKLLEKTKAPFVFSGYEFGDENATPNSVKVIAPNEVSYQDYLENNIIWTSTVLINLKTVNKESIYMPDRSYGEDALTWMKLLKEYGTAKGLPEPLAIYRRTSASLSANKIKIIKKKFALYWSIKDLTPTKRVLLCVKSLVNAAKKRTSKKLTKELSVQTLVATMHQTDHSILDRMNVQTDSIIVNQCDSFNYEKIKHGEKNSLFISLPERGVGLSRNTALMRATADIVLFADDDMIYQDGYEKVVADTFAKNPKADIIFFNVPSTNDERPTYTITKNGRVRVHQSLRYGAVNIAARTSSLHNHNITFSLLFGGGAKYQAGEDSVFIHSCLKSGLKAYRSIDIVGVVNQDDSTWFKGYDEKYFLDRGALFYNLSPSLHKILAIQFTIRKFGKLQSTLSRKEMLYLMLKGAKDAS